MGAGGVEEFTSDNILHIPRTIRPGEARGMSPIDEAALTLGTFMAATKHAGRFYRNGALLATVLEVPGEMGPEDAKALRAAFDEGHTGDNVFRTAVLTGGAKATTLGVTPEQAQFLDTLKHGTVEVCRIYRVPPMLVGVNEPGAVSYASAVEAVKAFARNTLSPFLRPIELAYGRLLPDGSYLRFDMDGLLRADPEQRYAAYAVGLEKGIFNRDTVRAWEELPPIGGKAGQLYTVQAQMVDLETIANPPPPPEAPPVPPSGGPPAGPDDAGDDDRHLAGQHDQKSHAGGGMGGGSGTKDDPIRTSDVAVAQQALGEGKYVQLRSERQVSTLVDKLATDVRAMEAAGQKPPDYDLCRVSVPKTNLFCSQSKGIPRAEMPQLKGRPVPGSIADGMPKNPKGEVDLSGAFAERLASRGIGVTEGTVDAKYLKASQNQLDGVKVVGMAGAMREGKVPAEAIFVTRDDYIVDGHHRWAATVANEYVTGRSITMPVRIIDADIIDVLGEANAFATEMGIPQAAFAQRWLDDCIPCSEQRYSPAQPRRPDGKFGSGGAVAAGGADPEVLQSRAKEVFGVTDNLREAGYVTPDGSMLDFTGRSQADGYRREGDRFVSESGPDYLAGERNLDHRDIGQALPDDYSGRGRDENMRMAVNAGFVRVSAASYSGDRELYGNASLEIHRPLTTAQYRTLGAQLRDHDSLTVDIVDAAGVTQAMADNWGKVGVSNATILREANDLAISLQATATRAELRAWARAVTEIRELELRYSPTQPRQPDGKFGGGPGGGSGYARLAKAGAEGGFSSTTHGDVPADGYMVSPYKGAEVTYDASTFNRRDVYDYTREHAELLDKPDHYLGGWRDGDKVYLDVSVRAATRDAAVQLARDNGQLAFYDVKNQTTVWTKEASAA
jgi:hypothetical protein